MDLVLTVSLIVSVIGTYLIASRPQWGVVDLPHKLLYIAGTFGMIFIVSILFLGLFVSKVSR